WARASGGGRASRRRSRPLLATRLSSCGDVERRSAPWLDAGEPRVRDVAMRCEEARVAGLELEDLVTRRAEDREVVGPHDPVPRDAVDEAGVRNLDRHGVALSERVDVREGREIGRAVPGDVDKTVLAGHE